MGRDCAKPRRSTAKHVPHTCLAITIDTGDADNIHPIDKEQVGDRLALLRPGRALRPEGPVRRADARSRWSDCRARMRLHFDHTDGGLVVKGDKLGEFSIAGDDRNGTGPTPGSRATP